MEDIIIEVFNWEIGIAIIILILSFLIGYLKRINFESSYMIRNIQRISHEKEGILKKIYVISNISIVFIIGLTIFNNLFFYNLLEYFSYLQIYYYKIIFGVILFFISYQIVPYSKYNIGSREGRLLLSLYIILPYSGMIINWLEYPISIFTAPLLIILFIIIRKKAKKEYSSLFEK
ncbi:MAG: hypothetical protein ACOCP8_02615 [archaeon]